MHVGGLSIFEPDGLQGDRVGMLRKVHLAMANGRDGDPFGVLLDDGRSDPPPRRPPRLYAPRPPPVSAVVRTRSPRVCNARPGSASNPSPNSTRSRKHHEGVRRVGPGPRPGDRGVWITVLDVSDTPLATAGRRRSSAVGPLAGSLGCSEFDVAAVEVAAEALATGEKHLHAFSILPPRHSSGCHRRVGT